MLVQSPGMKQEEPKDWRSEGPGSFKSDQSSRNVSEAEARTLMVIRAKRKRSSSAPGQRGDETSEDKKQRRKVAKGNAQLQDLRIEENPSPETGLRRTTPVLTTGVRGTSTSTTPVMNWDEGDSESSSEKETSTDDSFCSLMSIPDGEVQVIRGNSEESVYHQGYLGSVSRGTITNH